MTGMSRMRTTMTSASFAAPSGTPHAAMSASMERMLRAMKQDIPKQKRLLELNPSHPLIKRMKEMLDTNQDDAKLHDYIDLLYGQALLSEGSALKDPRRFTQLVADLMAKA